MDNAASDGVSGSSDNYHRLGSQSSNISSSASNKTSVTLSPSFSCCGPPSSPTISRAHLLSRHLQPIRYSTFLSPSEDGFSDFGINDQTGHLRSLLQQPEQTQCTLATAQPAEALMDFVNEQVRYIGNKLSSQELQLQIQTLNDILYEVLRKLSDRDSQNFSKMMEILSLRLATRTISMSFTLTPEQLESTETYLDVLGSHLDVQEGAYNMLKPPQHESRFEFDWKFCRRDDRSKLGNCSESVESSEEAGNTNSSIVTFEDVVSSVLDEEGKMEFMLKRFYNGVPLDARYLLQRHGTELVENLNRGV